MKITRFWPVVIWALMLVAALVIAMPAAADLVGMRQLEAGVSGKPASGFFASLTQYNLKESGDLTPELRWGNDYMHERCYSPVLGRFVSVDPVAGRVGSSQSANRYSYVLNNPVRLTDPTGMVAIADDLAVIGLVTTTAAIIGWWNSPAPGHPGNSNGEVIVNTTSDAIDATANTIKGIFNENTDEGDGEKAGPAEVDDFLEDTEPIREGKKRPKSEQYGKKDGGGFDRANEDFDAGNLLDVKDQGNGVRTGKTSDGSTVTVRPQNEPTIQIKTPEGRTIKIRY